MSIRNLPKIVCSMILLTLIVLLPIRPLRAEPVDTATGAAKSTKALSDKISQQWSCEFVGKIQVELRFQVTKEGNIYHLNLSKGFENPTAIRAAIHAVLFAMPLPDSIPDLEKSVVTCNISGDAKSPSFAISFSPGVAKNLADELGKVPTVEKVSRQTFINGPMALRLFGLCECLYDFPDSAEIRSEIQKICSFVGLDTKRAHDWVGIGRWNDRSVVIMRNPSEDARKELRVSLAAYLEAWRLKHDQAILYELEEAWIRSAAMEVLAASKADPLFLGNAALLTNQFQTAKEQYELALKDESAEAPSCLALLKRNIHDNDLRDLKLSPKFSPKGDSSDWEALLNWLPVDTELVLFENKSSKEQSGVWSMGNLSLFGGLILSSSPKDPRMGPTVEEQILKNNDLFEGVDNVHCFHAARTFKVPKGGFIGVGFSDSVDILVLPEGSKAVVHKVMTHLREQCIARQAIEGIEVLGFEKAPWSFGLTTFGEKKFVCSPCEGVLLVSTEVGYLREVLQRLRVQPDDRALPAGNPEWKLVDTSAKLWAVRHFDKSYIPFDSVGMYDIVTTKFEDRVNPVVPSEDIGEEIGFAFYLKESTLTVHQLSTNPKTLAGLAKSWPLVFNYDGMSDPRKIPQSSNNPKVSIGKDILSVQGTISERNMIALKLLISLGYFVAI